MYSVYDERVKEKKIKPRGRIWSIIESVEMADPVARRNIE